MDIELGVLQETGRIGVQAVDYSKNTPFARQYDIASSTLLLVHLEDGRECEFVRLVTGFVFILAGIHYSLVYVYSVPLVR